MLPCSPDVYHKQLYILLRHTSFFRYLMEAAKIMKSAIETTVLHFVFVKSRNEKTM